MLYSLNQKENQKLSELEVNFEKHLFEIISSKETNTQEFILSRFETVTDKDAISVMIQMFNELINSIRSVTQTVYANFYTYFSRQVQG